MLEWQITCLIGSAVRVQLWGTSEDFQMLKKSQLKFITYCSQFALSIPAMLPLTSSSNVFAQQETKHSSGVHQNAA
jgi:hypothetical protein